eukprot:1358516-Amorphochlora_amoeboformis.AAC.1
MSRLSRLFEPETTGFCRVPPGTTGTTGCDDLLESPESPESPDSLAISGYLVYTYDDISARYLHLLFELCPLMLFVLLLY